MDQPLHRRELLAAGIAGAGVLAGLRAASARQPNAAPATPPQPEKAPVVTTTDLPFKISLAQWSLHRELQSGKLDHLDFPALAASQWDIRGVEYVNTFFAKKNDPSYNAQLHKRCVDAGVRSVLIMCDGEGHIGAPEEKDRLQTVENHVKWLEAAKSLGCHSIRVNAQSSGTFEEQQKLAADGLRRLCERADPYGLNVIVENHWGLSSHGQWLAGVMKLVAHPRVGTLPDFGNFDPKVYDRYQGVQDMMPYAKGVSAKSHDFDPKTGEHTSFEYRRLMKIVMDANYHGFVGIEYEGDKIPEREGVSATKALLEKIREEIRTKGVKGP